MPPQPPMGGTGLTAGAGQLDHDAHSHPDRREVILPLLLHPSDPSRSSGRLWTLEAGLLPHGTGDVRLMESDPPTTRSCSTTRSYSSALW